MDLDFRRARVAVMLARLIAAIERTRGTGRKSPSESLKTAVMVGVLSLGWHDCQCEKSGVQVRREVGIVDLAFAIAIRAFGHCLVTHITIMWMQIPFPIGDDLAVALAALAGFRFGHGVTSGAK